MIALSWIRRASERSCDWARNFSRHHALPLDVRRTSAWRAPGRHSMWQSGVSRVGDKLDCRWRSFRQNAPSGALVTERVTRYPLAHKSCSFVSVETRIVSPRQVLRAGEKICAQLAKKVARKPDANTLISRRRGATLRAPLQLLPEWPEPGPEWPWQRWPRLACIGDRGYAEGVKWLKSCGKIR